MSNNKKITTMQNLGIMLIVCGVLAFMLAMNFIEEENDILTGLGVVLFLLGLLSIYVGIALLVSLWMLIAIPVIAFLFCLPEHRYY